MPPPTVFVVPHTHWDREWYQPSYRTRQRLVELVDDAILRLNRDDSIPGMMLDGQVAAVDDYLAIKPRMKAAVRMLVQSGRMSIGPWYVLADEQLCTDEVLVRNLMLGIERARPLGPVMPVGYSPDAFGHPAALPLILNGFGLDTALVWRGFGGPDHPPGDLFRWCAPDGSEVLAAHLPPDGYEFGAELPVQRNALAERWKALRPALVQRARSPHLLVLNGADHHALQPDVDKAVALLDDIEPDYTVQLSSLKDYFTAVRTGPLDIPTVSGELRSSYGYTWTLQGVLATRSRTKRVFAEGARVLTRVTEPLCALSLSAGMQDRGALLEETWRAYLLGCAHDSIGGCCTDEVAGDVHHRVHHAVGAARALADDSLLDLAGVDRMAARRATEHRPSVVVFNPAPVPRKGVVRATVPFFLADVTVGRPAAAPVYREARRPHVRITNGDVEMPVQVLAHRVEHERFDSPRDYPDQDIVQSVDVAVQTPAVDPLGVTGWTFEPGRSNAPVEDPVRIRGMRATSSWCAVAPGIRSFDIKQGRTRIFTHAPEVWSEDDAGDTYTFQPVRSGRPLQARWSAARAELRGPLVASLSRGFSVRNRVRGRMTVMLEAGSRLIRFRIDGENLADGHRLRVALPVESLGRVLADQAFACVTRPREPQVRHEHEWSVTTAPMHRYVSVPGPKGGVTVLGRGVFEYELTPDDYLALTVFRSVTELSRGDLPARPGHAGWPAPTPDAAELGEFSLEFAVLLHAVDEDANPEEWDTLLRAVDEFHVPVETRALRHAVKPVPRIRGPNLLGAGLEMKACRSARAGGILVRCCNPGTQPVSGEWQWPGAFTRAELVRLDETALQPLNPVDGAVSFVAPARSVVTVRLWTD